jgi:N-succinyldiaminopimelate aminotransferase
MPGCFLSREAHGINPGADYARIALVSGLDECKEGVNRLKLCVEEINAGKLAVKN